MMPTAEWQAFEWQALPHRIRIKHVRFAFYRQAAYCSHMVIATSAMRDE